MSDARGPAGSGPAAAGTASQVPASAAYDIMCSDNLPHEKANSADDTADLSDFPDEARPACAVPMFHCSTKKVNITVFYSVISDSEL